jgi:SAM-dependent methyltransferase
MKLETLKRIFRNRRDNIWGRCNICGKRTFFFTKDAREKGHLRDSLYCTWCKSVSRKRHVAKAIVERFAPQFDSLAQARTALRPFSIYSAVANDLFDKMIGEGNESFISSEFFPNVPAGEKKNGVICEDLERLSFADETFDLVLTEDVLEHVRHPQRAFAEIFRVLKPNGYHIFTIPFYFDRKTTARVDTTAGEDVYLMPPEYHGDTLRDQILVYTDFGYDLLGQLSTLGFKTEISFSAHQDAVRYGIADSYVFISSKCAAARDARQTHAEGDAT